MQNCTRHKLSVNAHNIRNGYNGYFWIIGERKFMSKCIFEWICSFERYLKVCSVFKLVEYTFLKYGMLTSNPTKPKPCSTFAIQQFNYKIYLWNPNHLKPWNNAFNKSPKTIFMKSNIQSINYIVDWYSYELMKQIFGWDNLWC